MNHTPWCNDHFTDTDGSGFCQSTERKAGNFGFLLVGPSSHCDTTDADRNGGIFITRPPGGPLGSRPMTERGARDFLDGLREYIALHEDTARQLENAISEVWS